MTEANLIKTAHNMKKANTRLETDFSTFVGSVGNSGLHIVIKDSFGQKRVLTITTNELSKIDFEEAIQYLKKEQNKASDSFA